MIHSRTDYSRIQDPALNDPSLLSEGSTAIAEDEPVILFRAKDKLFVKVLIAYQSLLVGSQAERNIIDLIQEHIERAREWQEKNKSIVKVPDIPKSITPMITFKRLPGAKHSITDELEIYWDNYNNYKELYWEIESENMMRCNKHKTLFDVSNHEACWECHKECKQKVDNWRNQGRKESK